MPPGEAEHHHSDREDRRELEQDHQAEAQHREEQQLTPEGDEHGLGLRRDPGELARREAQPQAEHDDPERDGKSYGGQR